LKNALYRISALFSPEQYHGWGRKKRFFEGWYYKIINEDETRAYAIIPGIAMDEQGNSQAFIQVLDGKSRTAEYIKFDPKEFRASGNKFDVYIAGSLFRLDEISLNLPSINGRLQFKEQVPWPTSWKSPGIMGPYSFVPFMECYHGILSMDHEIEGKLNIQGEEVDFTGGRGYMEKDWGRSFPGAYTWMQTNHFSEKGVSFKSSVANIPWLGSSFTGFIAGVLLNGHLYQFTTYNSTKLLKCHIDHEKVELLFRNKNYQLEVSAKREEATALASPIQGLMDGKIEESMCSEIFIILRDIKNNIVLLNDTGRNAALEVAGKIDEIIT
jgi:hypothetical protein